MIGAGVFGAFAPAAAAAGSGLLVGLGIAAVVAYCNATSSARLAALYPTSGGTYVYGRERLGPFWGYLAGWSFVVGKTASCAAMALTVGLHVWPSQAHVVAVAAVVVLTALNYVGVKKAARVIVAVVLVVLAVVVVTGLGSSAVALGNLGVTGGFGVLEAAGLLFFAFAGYARVATLGEEVRDPVRTIPRAIFLALMITLFVYAAVAVTVLSVLGPARLAESKAPLVDVVVAAGMPGLAPVVTVGASLAALGALLALVLGVSRTVLAMARDRHLPGALAVVHPRFSVPHRAELVVGCVVALAAGFADLRGVIGFSSFGVLLYYAIANASAFTLGRRVVPVVGFVGCVVLACTLPLASVLSGVAVVVVGIVLYAVR
ncbi:APC family permease [Allokutzneria sp. A3M-2-11 16]|uniref:APC family permease n=1 Tax=Allokutzneria sp. A3M-2-11 16 TaxID=2962043 RepID=UPI0020B6F5F1|nr:APC family permease [Allokutzneria sp. A3M-2-11 16]